MAILVQQSEATAGYRRMYFHCVDATDGITAEAGEVGGQPQWSLNGAAWGNTTGVLVAIGNGRYYVELVAATEVNNLGVIEGRYKSANTAESIGTTLQVVPYDPYDGVRMGLTALPNAVPQAAGGIVTSTAGAEFDARTLPSADYVVVGDTLAAVTTVTTCSTVTNGLTTANVSVAGGVVEANLININGTASNLDKLIDADTTVAADGNLDAIVVNGSVLAHIMTTDKTTNSYNATTDSLQAAGTDNDAIIVGTITNAQGADVATDVALLVGTDGKALISTDAQDLSATLDVNTKTITAGVSINVALATTLAVRTSDTVFTLNAGHTVNDAYVNMVLAMQDVTDSHWESRRITAYTGATKTVTVDTAFTFVVAANDVIRLYQNAYAPTAAAGGGATAAQVWAYDVDGIITAGQAGDYQKKGGGGRYG